MIKERAPFSKYDSDLPSEEFDLAVAGLLQKGLIKQLVIDGVVHYILTDMGAAVGQHIDSDPSTQN
jgi:hypothetical protein